MYNPITRPKTLAILAIILVLLTLTSTSLPHFQNTPKTQHDHLDHLHIKKHIQSFAQSTCKDTLHPKLCTSTISTFPNLITQSLPQIIIALINHTMADVMYTSSNCTHNSKNKRFHPIDQNALNDCLELFDSTIDEFQKAILDLTLPTIKRSNFHEIQTLLSGAMTNQYTCLYGFAHSKSSIRHTIHKRVPKITKQLSNSLAMLQKLPPVNTPEVFPMRNGYPTWLSPNDKGMLLGSNSNITKYDLVVAKDGSGDFGTINEALVVAPNNSATRFVIYIKEGVYHEYVEVIGKKSMLMFVGDGIGKTIIKGNRNVVDGWTTFRSSTLAVVGSNFLMKGITIENNAGPSKHQAVALRSGSDFSAFYKCSFIGYQDTLYVHSLRQFYRECDIYGTIDFIFGNAAAVFQNSNLYARRPGQNQKNVFTAQGREDPNQNTGFSIINCKIDAAADLAPVKTQFPTYLGRPWKAYSRTVIILSNIGDLINPAGWLEWSGDFALSTLFYGEYKNSGPGSNTSGRVSWPGYRIITNTTQALQYSAGSFIQGSEWLNPTGFPNYLNLS